MMQLLSAWKESLLLFKPSNFKLFFLVTLKSCIDTLKVWFRYWWWLIGLVMVGPYIMSGLLDWWFPINGQWVVAYHPMSFAGLGFSNSGVWQLLSPDNSFSFSPAHIRIGVKIGITCVLSLLYVSLYLCARPSVALKNWRYFAGYTKHFLYSVLWFLLLDKTFIVLDYINTVVPGRILDPETGTGILLLVMLSSISLFLLIFLLDSDASLKSAGLSVWRAAKMVLYNAPFFLIITLATLLIYYAVEGLFLLGVLALDALCKAALFEQPVLQWVILGLLNSIDIFFMLILACFFVNYYIKKTHENYSLYFCIK